MMHDMEKATYGLRCMCYGDIECKECPYARDGSGWYDCRSNCAKDALLLLNEQQKRIEALEIDRDILVKDINTNNCNTCKRQCEHRPELGEVVRVNCFMWEGR